MIRFRVSGYTLKSCSILFWGTENVTFMATSLDGRVVKIKMSAYEWYQEFESIEDKEFLIELL